MTLHPKKITCPFCLGRCNEIGEIDFYDEDGGVLESKLGIKDCSYCNGHGEVYLLTKEMYEWVKSRNIEEVVKT